MFYGADSDAAFASIARMMIDTSFGWWIRYIHANGASFFFICIYIHILRGIFYRSYIFPKTELWFLGVSMYFLLMAIAFLGYVLPWGQMSFWAAMVITNFVTIVPFFGELLLEWIWGNYCISIETLIRFYSLHFTLPVFLLVFLVLHLMVLHESGSTDEATIKIDSALSNISFFPYFILKDIFSIVLVFFLFFLCVHYFPEWFNHHINYEEADPLVTPNHIVPEWYFLPFYAILRSVPNKIAGILAMFISIFVLYLLPILDKDTGFSRIYNRTHTITFFIFALNFILLGYIGSQTMDHPSIEFGLLSTCIHLAYYFIYLPLSSGLERYYHFHSLKPMFIKFKHNRHKAPWFRIRIGKISNFQIEGDETNYRDFDIPGIDWEEYEEELDMIFWYIGYDIDDWTYDF